MGTSEEKQKGGPCGRIRERPKGRRMRVGREKGPFAHLGGWGSFPEHMAREECGPQAEAPSSAPGREPASTQRVPALR